MNQSIILRSLCYVTKSFEKISSCSTWINQELTRLQASDLKLKKALELKDVERLEILIPLVDDSCVFNEFLDKYRRQPKFIDMMIKHGLVPDQEFINDVMSGRNYKLIEVLIKNKLPINISDYVYGGRGSNRVIRKMLTDDKFNLQEYLDRENDYTCLIL